MNIIKEITRLITVLKFRNKGVELQMGKNTRLKHCKVKSKGKGNRIIIAADTRIDRCKFTFLGSDSTIIIGNACNMCDMEFHFENKGNEIILGDKVCFARNVQLAACEGTKIVIGDESIFAHDTLIRTTDSHSILDSEGKRINPAQDIVIGKHVWVGLGVLILKGCRIADNNIIAAKSLVSSKIPYEENIILAGSPAKKIKEGISWDPNLL